MQQAALPLRQRSLIDQSKNNTTLWIGHLADEAANHIGGQTFICPDTGELNNIQVFISLVPHYGVLELSLHDFDEPHHQWGNALSSSRLEIETSDKQQWVRFDMPPVLLTKGKSYAFRVFSKDAMVGLGEAASHRHEPFAFGQVWKANSTTDQGYYYSYFSLAFRIEVQ